MVLLQSEGLVKTKGAQGKSWLWNVNPLHKKAVEKLEKCVAAGGRRNRAALQQQVIEQITPPVKMLFT